MKYIRWFKDLTINDVPLVGGKNASLGEMYKNLTSKGVKVPNGFAVTAKAYQYLLEKSGVEDEIKRILKDLNTHDIKNLQDRGRKVRRAILNAKVPEDLKKEIFQAYKKLGGSVAVRSSATAEDLPDASFAGQQETYLNIKGEEELLEACKKCFASLFTNRAISYREDKGFGHFKVYLSIGIQKMVKSTASGVMFSIDTETGFKDAVLINSAYGLGENVVQGSVNPDEFYVFKPTLKKGYNSIISKKVGEKAIKMIYCEDGNHTTKNVNVPNEEREKYSLKDEDILLLAKWACVIEDHYSKKAGYFKPMDMEWAKDETGLYIVQARPETVQSQKDKDYLEEYSSTKGKIIVEGRSVGDRIGQGNAHVIKEVKDIKRFKKGEVLVTDMTDPDWEPIMKIASAIVTNRGGRTCHAAIISRELGIPCVVGCLDATKKIKNGKMITVSCAEGDVGKIYEGKLKITKKKINLKNIPKSKVKIMMNVGTPERAFEFSRIPNEGVGLARMEFIINNYIKVHPRALLEFNKLDEEEKEKINEIVKGNKEEFFIEKLSNGIAMIAAAFYPKDVIVRFSDFKTNEYANLVGGSKFEPEEDNPMIGWRGASRYYKEYREAFELELKAIKKVQEKGLKNVIVMVPFCRTVEEAKKVKKIIKDKLDIKIYGMCEIPSNVILAEEFLNVFDGFSIGSNDLTQLVLGVDRDSALVSDIYDERNEAVKKMISEVIKVAKKKKKYIGICGDAPSTFPEIVKFLEKEGIDSMSLSPDAVMKVRLIH